MVPAAKMFKFSGQKTGPENTKYGTQKWDQKSVPGCFLVIIIIRGGIFRGTVSGPPKCVPRHVFQAPFLGAENSSGTRGNFTRKAKKNASTNPSIQKTLAFPILILLLLAMRLIWQPQAARCQSKHISCFLFCRKRRAQAC